MKHFNIKKAGIYLKEKINTNMAIFLIIILILGINLNNSYQDYKNINYLTDELIKAQEQIPSEEEKKLIEYKNKILEVQLKIKKRNIVIRELQKEVEKYENFEECFKGQVGRVINGQESLINYCDDQFSDVKETLTTDKKNLTVEKKVIRNDWNIDDKRQDYINYVLDKAGKDALLTFTGENTFWTIDRPSTNLGTGGYRAYGFCQLYYKYHKPFIDSEEFKDPYKQLDYCIGVYKDGDKRGILNTTFYAYPGRSKWNYLYKFL